MKDETRKDEQTQAIPTDHLSEGTSEGSNQMSPNSTSAPKSRLQETQDFSFGDTQGDENGPFDEKSLPVRLGRYEITKLLGRGGMGSVYLARDRQLERDVGLKVPRFKGTENEKAIKRFYREARAAATLSHPNLCAIYDVAEIDGIHCIAMAYIKGHPLSDYIDSSKPPDAKAASTMIYKVALAMDEAHQNGILHRDLKPANIMVDKRKEPIVMDFGLACQSEGSDDSRLTQAGTLLGSPAYMSPEQLKGKIELLGPASDQYSLGVVLYELLSGRLPFDSASSTITLLSNILTEFPQPLEEIRPDLDPHLVAIVSKSISKDPSDRFPSMKAFATELAGFVRKTKTDLSNQLSRKKTQAIQEAQPETTATLTKPSSTMVDERQPTKGIESEATTVTGLSSTPESPVNATSANQESMFENLPPISAGLGSSGVQPFKQYAATKSDPTLRNAMFAVAAALVFLTLVFAGWAVMDQLSRKQPAIDSTNQSSLSDETASTDSDDMTNSETSGSSKQAPQTSLSGDTQQTDDAPPVSPEQKAFANQLLRRFDRNNDDKLTEDEVPLPEVARMMQGDRNSDGELDRAEIEHMAKDGVPILLKGLGKIFGIGPKGPNGARSNGENQTGGQRDRRRGDENTRPFGRRNRPGVGKGTSTDENTR